MSDHPEKSPQEIFIERCPHDSENPYAQISRHLIRDQSISPECRWLLIYLLSMDRGWKISVKQIWAHTKGFIGLKKLYKIIKEACEAGYMKSEIKFKGNLKQGVKYYLSETPKFKDSNNFSDAAVSGAPKLDAPKSAEHKKELSKERTFLKKKNEMSSSKTHARTRASARAREEEDKFIPHEEEKKIEVSQDQLDVFTAYCESLGKRFDERSVKNWMAAYGEDRVIQTFDYLISQEKSGYKIKIWPSMMYASLKRDDIGYSIKTKTKEEKSE